MRTLLLSILLSSCSTLFVLKADIVDKRDGKYTLRYFTGDIPNWYAKAFEDKANEICPKGYDVLEKTRKPTTLTIWPNEQDFFYWVVKCHQIRSDFVRK